VSGSGFLATGGKGEIGVGDLNQSFCRLAMSHYGNNHSKGVGVGSAGGGAEMLSIKVEHGAKAHVVVVAGDLAFDTSGRLREALQELAHANGLPVIIDMAGLEFIDSKGVALLVQAGQAFKRKGFALAGLRPEIRDVLDRLFLLDQFHVVKKVEEAVRNADLMFA
jgi:anti-sigma B factor antagonist